MNFADTNWLEAMFFQLTDADKASRGATVERFMRKQGGQLGLSHVVYLEARNVFSRVAGEAEPEEWRQLEQGFGGRFYLDPMNWDLLRRETFRLIAKYAHKINFLFDHPRNCQLNTSIINIITLFDSFF